MSRSIPNPTELKKMVKRLKRQCNLSQSGAEATVAEMFNVNDWNTLLSMSEKLKFRSPDEALHTIVGKYLLKDVIHATKYEMLFLSDDQKTLNNLRLCFQEEDGEEDSVDFSGEHDKILERILHFSQNPTQKTTGEEFLPGDHPYVEELRNKAFKGGQLHLMLEVHAICPDEWFHDLELKYREDLCRIARKILDAPNPSYRLIYDSVQEIRQIQKTTGHGLDRDEVWDFLKAIDDFLRHKGLYRKHLYHFIHAQLTYRYLPEDGWCGRTYQEFLFRKLHYGQDIELDLLLEYDRSNSIIYDSTAMAHNYQFGIGSELDELTPEYVYGYIDNMCHTIHQITLSHDEIQAKTGYHSLDISNIRQTVSDFALLLLCVHHGVDVLEAEEKVKTIFDEFDPDAKINKYSGHMII